MATPLSQKRVPIRLGDITTRVRDSTPLTGPLLRVCRVCAQQNARYSCPKCNTPYCSAACYQGHNVQCTESFFKNHIDGELKVTSTDEKDREKTVKILKKAAAARMGGPQQDDLEEVRCCSNSSRGSI